MNSRPLELAQFLKLMGAVSTGGEAKVRIQGGEVWVNGEVETRRGRKMAQGDEVRFGEQTFIVNINTDPQT